MEDGKIIDLYWARDQLAITASDEKYGAQCRSLSARLLDSPEDGEECVNDTWHRAWITMPPQRPAALRAYFMKILRNLCVDRWRAGQAQKRWGGLERMSLELEECLPAVRSAEQEAEDREVTACIQNWLDGLKREERAMFLHRYWHGERVDELAAVWGVSPNVMAQRLRRLRHSLKKTLEREGIVL